MSFRKYYNKYRVCWTYKDKSYQTYLPNQETAELFSMRINQIKMEVSLPFVKRQKKCNRRESSADLPVGIYEVKANPLRKTPSAYLSSIICFPNNTRKQVSACFEEGNPKSRADALNRLLKNRQKAVDLFCRKTGYCLYREKYFANLVGVSLEDRKKIN